MEGEIQQPVDVAPPAVVEQPPVVQPEPVVAAAAVPLEDKDASMPPLEAAVVVAVEEKKPKHKKQTANRRLPCTCRDCTVKRQQPSAAVSSPDADDKTAVTKKKAVKDKKKRITRKVLESFVYQRIQQRQQMTRDLFEETDSEPINDMGDMRYMGCTLHVPMGPFKAGDTVGTVDLFASAGVVLLNNTNRISETVVLAMAPAAIQGPEPLDVFQVPAPPPSPVSSSSSSSTST
jgi:hypothetical protein